MNIKGLDKAVILAALYNNSRPQGVIAAVVGFRRPMTVDEARVHLESRHKFDYLNGRVLKVDLDEDDLFLALYDRDNGQGSGEAAIRAAFDGQAT